MTSTTTRARTNRTAVADRGRPTERGANYGAYTAGANALKVGYADLDERDAPIGYAPPSRPAIPTPRNQPRRPAHDGRPARSTAAPAPAPLPIALPRAPFLVLIVGLVVAGVLGVLVLNTKINENSFTLDNLRGQRAQLDLQQQQLQQQLADKESTGDLAAEAARLGLVPAGNPAFITLPDGHVIGVPQPAPRQAGANATTTDPGR